MNEGNRETRSATAQAIYDSELFMAKTFVEHAETWNKILIGAPLQDGEELRRGIILFNMGIMEVENRYNQFRSGYLTESDWQSAIEGLKPFRNLPMYEIWRLSAGAASRSLEFRELFHNLK